MEKKWKNEKFRNIDNQPNEVSCIHFSRVINRIEFQESL